MRLNILLHLQWKLNVPVILLILLIQHSAWASAFDFLVCIESYIEEVIIYNKFESFESTGLPDKLDGCAHAVRITSPFVINITNDRPKLEPVAYWSCRFMHELVLLVFLRICTFYVVCMWVFQCFGVGTAVESLLPWRLIHSSFASKTDVSAYGDKRTRHKVFVKLLQWWNYFWVVQITRIWLTYFKDVT